MMAGFWIERGTCGRVEETAFSVSRYNRHRDSLDMLMTVGGNGMRGKASRLTTGLSGPGTHYIAGPSLAYTAKVVVNHALCSVY